MKWLKNYYELEIEIQEMEWEIERSKLELKRWKEGGDLFHKNSFESSLIQQQKVQSSISLQKNTINDIKKLMDDLLKMIDTFEGLDNKIMRMKHVDGMTLDIIAEELHYSPNYIYNKHAEMMRKLQFAKKIRDGEQWMKALK